MDNEEMMRKMFSMGLAGWDTETKANIYRMFPKNSLFDDSGGLVSEEERVLFQDHPDLLAKHVDLKKLLNIRGKGTPDEQRAMIRHILQDNGTDVNKNDSDPFGNGDQSSIQSFYDQHHASQMYRAVSEMHLRQIQGIRSTFANACVEGDIRKVRMALDSICSTLDPPYCQRNEYNSLLETRETEMRLSPLMMVVSCWGTYSDISDDKMNQLSTITNLFVRAGAFPDVCKDILEETFARRGRPLSNKKMNQLSTIAKILLRAGASPDCKDVLGKTVVHHGAGCHATPVSLAMVDMCIAAAKSSDLYGKDVVLEGLNAEYMNGKTGIVGGYDCDTNRRSVYIHELKKEVWVKPEKIRLLDGKERKEKPKLVDVPDRVGQVALFAIMEGWYKGSVAQPERDDVAEYLLHKHGASIYIKDGNGASPAEASVLWSNNPNGRKVTAMIAAIARADTKKLRDAKKIAENVCANCKKSLGQGGSKCAKCKVTFYCCRECQVQHWKQGGHKQKCKEIVAIAAGVKLSSEHLYVEDPVYNRYQKPNGVEVGEKFVVAVMGLAENDLLIVCDESRACQFQYEPTGPGHAQIWREVEKETTWDGKKTFMKASFDEAGECTLYPSTACVKNKYAW